MMCRNHSQHALQHNRLSINELRLLVELQRGGGVYHVAGRKELVRNCKLMFIIDLSAVANSGKLTGKSAKVRGARRLELNIEAVFFHATAK